MTGDRRTRKRLPWTYYHALRRGGKRVDEGRARESVRRVGLDAVSGIGGTPLTVAAELGRDGMVRWLLEQGANVEDVAPHENFQTALCAAAYGKRLDAAAALLIAAGANLEACNGSSNTPLANTFINCLTNPLPPAALLIENGAVITERVRKFGENWNAPAFQAFLSGVPKGDEQDSTAEPVLVPD